MGSIQVDSRRLEKLERASSELNDYRRAAQIIRARGLDMGKRAHAASVSGGLDTFAEGWLAGQREWAEAILQAVRERVVE